MDLMVNQDIDIKQLTTPHVFTSFYEVSWVHVSYILGPSISYPESTYHLFCVHVSSIRIIFPGTMHHVSWVPCIIYRGSI